MDEKLTSKALEVVDQLAAGLKAVAPQMVDVTLSAIRFYGLFYVIVGAITLVLSPIVIFALVKVWIWTSNINEYNEGGKHFGGVVCCLGLISLSILLVVATLVNLLDYMKWAAVFDPRIYLALRVLNATL